MYRYPKRKRKRKVLGKKGKRGKVRNFFSSTLKAKQIEFFWINNPSLFCFGLFLSPLCCSGYDTQISRLNETSYFMKLCSFTLSAFFVFFSFLKKDVSIELRLEKCSL